MPVALCIAPEESREAWAWFLRKIKKNVVVGWSEDTICLISDCGSGIIAAVNDVDNGWQPPFVVHRFCIHHVASNFNKVYRSQRLKNLVNYAGHQAQLCKFEVFMKMVQDLNEDVVEWFNKVDRNGNPVLMMASIALGT